MKKALSEAALTLTSVELAELERLALRCPYDISELTYTETQQVITLYALSEFIKSFGLEPQFELSPSLRKGET